MNDARILSIATAVPPFRMTRADWLAIADRISPAGVDRALLARLAERSGIEARHCAAFARGIPAAAGANAAGDARPANEAHAGWSRVEGSQEEGVQVEGTQVEGIQVGGIQVGGIQVGGTKVERTQVEGTQVEGTQVDASFYLGEDRPGTAARVRLWSRAARAMSLEAATAALARAGLAGDRAARVTHLVTASCTGFESPGIDSHLIESLGLAPTVSRLNVGFMGCHALVNALAAARHAVRGEPGATALVVATEVSSAHFHHSSRLDQLVANTLFADGSAALVVGAGDGAPHGSGEACRTIEATTGPVPPARALPTIAATHSIHLAATADEMAWTVGDHGFEMTLGARVPACLEREVGAWVSGALARHGRTVGEVGGWAVHPGGPRVLDAVAAALGLDEAALAASRAVLRDHGNMSSATLGFILARLAADGAPRPWVALAFGPGLVGEMLVVE